MEAPPLASSQMAAQGSADSASSATRSSRAYSISATQSFPSSDYHRHVSQLPSIPDPFVLDEPAPTPPPVKSMPLPPMHVDGALSPSGSRSPARGSFDVSRTSSPVRMTRGSSRTTSRPASPFGSPMKRALTLEGKTLSLAALQPPQLFIQLSADPLLAPLTQFVPPTSRPRRDTEGRYDGLEVPQMVASGSWRALANLARDTIRNCNPEDFETIMEMFLLRHIALVSLHLPNHHTRELNILFNAIAHLSPLTRNHLSSNHLVPFPLEVMFAKSRGVDSLTALLRKCKVRARKATEQEERESWTERGMRVGLVMASVLIDAGEPVTALRLLQPLLDSPSVSVTVLSAVHRLHLSTGNLPAAEAVLARLAAHPSASETEKTISSALSCMAAGDSVKAEAILSELVRTSEGTDDGIVASNALAVSQLYNNKLDDAIHTLNAALTISPSTSLIEPLVFNLATLYELRQGSVASTESKIDLLLRCATWSGDGLRPACLKLA